MESYKRKFKVVYRNTNKNDLSNSYGVPKGTLYNWQDNRIVNGRRKGRRSLEDLSPAQKRRITRDYNRIIREQRIANLQRARERRAEIREERQRLRNPTTQRRNRLTQRIGQTPILQPNPTTTQRQNHVRLDGQAYATTRVSDIILRHGSTSDDPYIDPFLIHAYFTCKESNQIFTHPCGFHMSRHYIRKYRNNTNKIITWLISRHNQAYPSHTLLAVNRIGFRDLKVSGSTSLFIDGTYDDNVGRLDYLDEEHGQAII